MKLIIVRHAQTNENLKSGDAARESNVLLNRAGIEQAKKLGYYLKGETILAAYVSPQARAIHTAQEVLVHHPSASLVHVDDLNEQSLGEYAAFSKEVLKVARKNAGELFHLFKGKGGESYLDVQTRATAFVNSLKVKHNNDTVLLVSHGATLGALYLHLLNKEFTEENYKAHKPENSALSIIEISDNQSNVYKFNTLEHLD